MSSLSVRFQALSLGGAAGLRLWCSAPTSGLEARGAGPTGGRPILHRLQTRRVLPTHGLPLSLLPGVHERESADLLPVPEPNQPEFCSCDSSAGRGVEVSETTGSRAVLPARRGVSAGMFSSLETQTRALSYGALPLSSLLLSSVKCAKQKYTCENMYTV